MATPTDDAAGMVAVVVEEEVEVEVVSALEEGGGPNLAV